MAIAFIVILVFVVFLIAVASKSANEERREKMKDLEKRITTTGFSSFTFKLKGSGYCSDVAKEFLANIKEGDAVVLMPEFFNEFDKYAISVRLYGKHIGYVDRSVAYEWAGRLFDGGEPNYRLCVAKTVTLNEGFDYPIVEFEVFYRKFGGVAKIDFKHCGADYVYIDPIEGCGKDLKEDLEKRFFTLCTISKEIINTHPEWYNINKEDTNDDLNNNWYFEDVKYLKTFIFELYTGQINRESTKEQFLKRVSMDRVYGNNEKLKLLLGRYLEFKELELK